MLELIIYIMFKIKFQMHILIYSVYVKSVNYYSNKNEYTHIVVCDAF